MKIDTLSGSNDNSPPINAMHFTGDLVGKLVRVNANHRNWFQEASAGSALRLTEPFRVVAVEKFGGVSYISFAQINPDEKKPRVGYCDGCAEHFRFDVLGP